jgi:DNA-binding Xre family transcriptional regulator
MLKVQTIQEALQDRNLSEIARRIDISIHTLVKMRDGKFDSLYTSKVQLVSDYLQSTGVSDKGAHK